MVLINSCRQNKNNPAGSNVTLAKGFYVILFREQTDLAETNTKHSKSDWKA